MRKYLSSSGVSLVPFILLAGVSFAAIASFAGVSIGNLWDRYNRAVIN